MNKKKILDVSFLAFEAIMHIYLVLYLISIDASVLAILFTAFELSMFVRLLFNNKKEMRRLPCTWHEVCCRDLDP